MKVDPVREALVRVELARRELVAAADALTRAGSDTPGNVANAEGESVPLRPKSET